MSIKILNKGSGPVRDVVLVYHGSLDPSLYPEAVIASDNQPGFKRLYEATDRGGILELNRAIDEILNQVGEFEVGETYLVGFSEGVQALRAHLRDGYTPHAVVAIDGTHTASAPKEMETQLAPWRDFIARARAGQVVFIASHSAIDPISYESTTKTLRRITGLPLAESAPVPACVRSQDGNVIVYSCTGGKAEDHVAQAKFMLPKLFAEARTIPASLDSTVPDVAGEEGSGGGLALGLAVVGAGLLAWKLLG